MRNRRIDYVELSGLTDAEVWQQLKSGDRGALDFIFNQYVEVLILYGNKFTPDTFLVEDSIQDIFINLWNKRKSISDTDAIKPYLLTSLRRKIIKAVSGKRIVIDKDFEIDSYNFLIEYSAEERLVNNQMDKQTLTNLSKVLNNLSQKQREIIYLKYYSKLNNFEIASVMSINYQSARNLIHKALKNMRAQLENGNKSLS
ncbi:MAG: sigma-70 family RNA polymerase sigma factor [Reichenbachiella sp.]